jgi:serine/threonine protein kinase
VLGAARQRGTRPLTGSLAYMPPEQILGRSPGFRNDVFAFGVVLFQMLTGRLPFPATQPAAASSLVRRLTAEAPPPSQIVPALPRWLDEVVRTCLAGQDLRFQDVEAVLEVLESN